MESSSISIIRITRGEADLYLLAIVIRKAVFIEEQGVDPALEYENEEESVFYLVFAGEKAVGTGRWRNTEKGIKLERFAVLPEYRGRGIGTFLLKELLQEIKPFRKRIYLHSQLTAVEYYKRAGFETRGEIFTEAG
ncbi:MAG: GNAT family N-acetyltransferase, partial [Bacteroidales bacterium]|nr:GNAT family N-acetyltransferase [Bacteroidales bacterium]